MPLSLTIDCPGEEAPCPKREGVQSCTGRWLQAAACSVYPQSPLTYIIKPPPPLTPHPPTAQTLPRQHTCVSAARRGIEAARPWLSNPGWGSPSGPLNVMFCIWTSTAWRTVPPQLHIRVIWPCSSHLTCSNPDLYPPLPHHLTPSSTHSPIPTSQSSPQFTHPHLTCSPYISFNSSGEGSLTSFPGCPTGISAEWPRSRGALAS